MIWAGARRQTEKAGPRAISGPASFVACLASGAGMRCGSTLTRAVASSASATIVADVVVDAIVGTVPTVDGVNVHWLCPSG